MTSADIISDALRKLGIISSKDWYHRGGRYQVIAAPILT